MAKRSASDCRINRRLAGAGDVMHVHAERMTNTVREEGRAVARRQDCFLRVPRAGAWRIGRLEDAQFLEAFDERAVADELHCVPVQAGVDDIEGFLEYFSCIN